MDLGSPYPNRTVTEDLGLLAEEAKRAGELPWDSHDVYGNHPALQAFESKIATHLGKEAGMFSITGIAAQEIAFLCHLGEHQGGTERVYACHPSSHLLLHEQNAYDKLLGAKCVLLGDKDRVLTAGEVISGIDGASVKPQVVYLELPQRENGGVHVSYEDLVKIRSHTQALGIKLHMDGARLWEASAFYAPRTLPDVCALFDTVYVSFYKGVGAMAGAVLVGSPALIAEARLWRRRMGGNLFTSTPYALDCRRSFRNTVDPVNTFPARADHMRAVTAALLKELGDRGLRAVPPVPETCMVHLYIRGSRAKLEGAHTALVAKGRVQSIVTGIRKENADQTECYAELKMGTLSEGNGQYSIEDYVTAWREFLDLRDQ